MSQRRKAGDIVTKPTGRCACHVCECEMGEP